MRALLWLCLGWSLSVSAAEPDGITFHEPTEDLDHLFEGTDFTSWMEKLFQTLDAKTPDGVEHPFMMDITIRHDGMPIVEGYGSAELPEGLVRAVSGAASGVDTSIRTRFGDLLFTVAYNYDVKPRNQWFTEPKLETLTPALRKRAGEYMLPLAAAQLRTHCAGVPCKDVADLLETMVRTGRFEVDTLYSSASWWSALVQMPPGDPRVSTLPMFVHMAAGEFEMALHHTRLLSLAKEDLTSAHVQSARVALNKWEEILGEQVTEGIRLHKEGQLDDAIAHYDALLEIVGPNAWLMHERNQSRLMKGLSTHEAGLEVDPLFSLMTTAAGPEAMAELMLRIKLQSLFKDPTAFLADTESKADIALRLGEYGFAGLSWFWLMQVEATDPRKSLDTLVYCLHKAGAPTDDWGDARKQIKRTTKRLR